jgi:hypothetical protein
MGWGGDLGGLGMGGFGSLGGLASGGLGGLGGLHGSFGTIGGYGNADHGFGVPGMGSVGPGPQGGFGPGSFGGAVTGGNPGGGYATGGMQGDSSRAGGGGYASGPSSGSGGMAGPGSSGPGAPGVGIGAGAGGRGGPWGGGNQLMQQQAPQGNQLRNNLRADFEAHRDMVQGMAPGLERRAEREELQRRRAHLQAMQEFWRNNNSPPGLGVPPPPGYPGAFPRFMPPPQHSAPIPLPVQASGTPSLGAPRATPRWGR